MSLKTDKISRLIESSYKNNHKAKKIAPKRFKLQENLSNDKHKVFIDSKNKIKPIVVFRGTDITNPSDIASDLKIAVGLEKTDNRFKNSRNFTEKLRKKYDSNLNIIGHSLGGRVGEFSAKKNDRIITVNKGAGLNSINKNIGKNQTDIRNRYDAVSALSAFNNRDSKKSLITLTDKNIKIANQLPAHNFRQISKIEKNIKLN
jgi:predicted nucleotidyltransferase